MQKIQARTRTSWGALIGALALHRLSFFLLILAAPVILPGFFNRTGYGANFHGFSGEPPGLMARFETWDAQQYLFISRNGYRKDHISNGFMPFWPWLIRIFAPAVSGDHLAAALILANFFSIAGAAVFFRFVEERAGPGAATASLLLLLCHPGAFYFSLPYTEALFFFLSALFLKFLFERRYAAVFVVSAFLAITRSIGFLSVVPILCQLASCRERPVRWLVILGPALGVAATLWVFAVSTGNAFAYYEAQTNFIRYPATIGRLWDWPSFFVEYFRPERVLGYPTGIVERVLFAWYAAALVPLWKKDKVFFGHAAAVGLFPALTHHLLGFTRFMTAALPVYVTGDILSGKRRTAFIAVLSGLASFQLILLARHTHWYWVS